jgi:hypothetical protein
MSLPTMLITKHFVFVHFQKTGGVFFRRLCHEHLPSDWIVAELERTHAGYDLIPAEYAHLPAITFIRNPWDWYVSWYHWETQYLGSGEREAPSSETHPWTTLLGRGSYDFREAVTRACTRREGARPWEVAMQAWDVDMLTAIYAIKTGHYPGALPPALAHRAPQDGRAVEVGRFEHLRDDFLAFLERNEVPAPEPFLEAVRSAPPRHGSRRGAYEEYYDDELRDVVGRTARHVISEHGYEY